jgi:hypothetical protein
MGLSVSLESISALVQDQGYPVMLSSYNRTPAMFPQFCRVVPNSAASFSFQGHKSTRMVGPAGLSPVKPGAALPSTTMAQGYSWQVAIQKYGREISFPVETFETPQWRSVIGDAAQMLGEEWGALSVIAKDTFAAGVLQKGTIATATATTREYFNNSFPGHQDPNVGYIYDGKAFFAADHPNAGTSTTYSNVTASAALSASTLDAGRVLIAQTNAKDELGKQALIKPNLLICGPSLERTALTLVNSELTPGTSNNDINTLRGQFKVLSNPYLTDDATAWWLGEANRGLVAIDSGVPILETAMDATGQNVVIRVRTYFGCGVEDWRYWAAFDKATS